MRRRTYRAAGRLRYHRQRAECEEKLAHIKSSEDYPAILVETAEKCPQTIDYVYAYPEKHDKCFDIDLSAEAHGGSVPLFIQWDERWGYEPYGSGFIGTSGCGPTCLSMAAVYLSKNAAFSPLYVAHMAEQYGYCVPGNGSSWTLIGAGSAVSVSRRGSSRFGSSR